MVVAVQVHLEARVPDLGALQQPVLDSGVPGRGHERREPVEAREHSVADRPWLDVTRPAHNGRHAERAFPVGVLLAAERRNGGVGPSEEVRPVVRGEDHDCVIRNAQVIQGLQKLADVLVHLPHAIGVFVAPGAQTSLATVRLTNVGEDVHAGKVHPGKERTLRFNLAGHEIDRR